MDENDAFSSSLIDTFRTTSAIFLTLSSEDRILGVCLLVLCGDLNHGVRVRVRQNKSKNSAKSNHSTTLPSSFLHWKWMNMFRSECKLAWTFIWNAIKLEKSGWFLKTYRLFIFNASSALLCTIWSWWSKCQNTIRKVVFVVFPVQPESESTISWEKRCFQRTQNSVCHTKEFKMKSSWNSTTVRFKYWAKRGWAGFRVYQIACEIIDKIPFLSSS